MKHLITALALIIAGPAFAQTNPVDIGCGIEPEYLDDLVYYGDVKPIDGVFDAGAENTNEVIRSEYDGQKYLVTFSNDGICILKVKQMS